MASTFIQKVLNKRQEDFDGAWNKFSDTVKTGGAELPPHESKDPNDKFSAISTSPMKQKGGVTGVAGKGTTGKNKGNKKGNKGQTSVGKGTVMSKSMSMDTMVQVCLNHLCMVDPLPISCTPESTLVVPFVRYNMTCFHRDHFYDEPSRRQCGRRLLRSWRVGRSQQQ